MERIEEYLREAGIPHTQASDYLHLVDAFRTQLQAVFVQADVESIFVALCLMTELHLVQAPRPDGSLSIEHPLAVAFQVLDAMAAKDPELVIATLLHDSAEDQTDRLAQKASQKTRDETLPQTALRAIEEITGSVRVKNIVSGLTNPDFDALLSQRGIKKQSGTAGRVALVAARNTLYSEHVRDAIRDPDVALIKMFDFAANALHLDAISDVPRRTRLRNKYYPVLSIMLDRLHETGNPLNILSPKREEMLARFADALHAFSIEE